MACLPDFFWGTGGMKEVSTLPGGHGAYGETKTVTWVGCWEPVYQPGCRCKCCCPGLHPSSSCPTPHCSRPGIYFFCRRINIRQQLCWVRELSWKVPGQKGLGPSSAPAGMRAARSKCCSPQTPQQPTQTKSKAPGQYFGPCLTLLLIDQQG